MSGAAFPSPTVEMAEINRIQYELDYTEGISQKMRIPQMLKVAPQPHDEPDAGGQEFPHSVVMQVPDRIVIAGDSSDPQLSRPRDLDLIQSTPLETLSLKTPPRVLTLNERPLDFMEEEKRAAPDSEEIRPHGRLQRERSASENAAVLSVHTPSRPPATVQPCPPRTVAEENNLHSTSGVLSFIQSTTRRAYRQVLEVLDENPRRLAFSTYEPALEGPADDLTLVDATTLRRQLIKLNRRLQHLEEENKERAKREMIIYSISVAFWLVNTWVWLRR
uniref:Mitochondrial fission factor n=1 Tax=Kryptolebias marmoratus TaxID=37003 RepID=A0A3Q2ZKD2_KRYMA